MRGMEKEVLALHDILGEGRTKYMGRQCHTAVIDTVIKTKSGCNQPRMNDEERRVMRCVRRGRRIEELYKKHEGCFRRDLPDRRWG